MIEFKHVSKVYQKANTKLVANDDISFTILTVKFLG